MIRKAIASEIDELMALTRECAKKMISDGIFQWNEHYPHRKAFEEDVLRSELYVLEIDEKLKGCIVVSIIKDREYDDIEWLTPDKGNIYIHRLAVHPDLQGKGYARKLMDFAEDLALRNGMRSVRLDTFSQNKRNQRFYENRGYTRLGDIFFPKQSIHPFHCFELVFDSANQ